MRITIDYEAEENIDQVEIWLDGATWRRPLGGADIPSGSAIVVVLDDSRADRDVDLVVWGIRSSVGRMCAPVGTIRPRSGKTTSVDAHLAPSSPSPCGDPSILQADCTCPAIGLPDECTSGLDEWDGWAAVGESDDCEPILPPAGTPCPGDTNMPVIGNDVCESICRTTDPGTPGVTCSGPVTLQDAANAGGTLLVEPCPTPYDAITITVPVVLRGRCTGGTVAIKGATAPAGPAVVIDANDADAVTLEGLRIEDCPNGGIEIRGGGDVTLRDVDVSGCGSFGIRVSADAGTVRIEHSVIRDIAGVGVELKGNATRTLDQVAIIGAAPGITIADAGVATALDRCLVDSSLTQGMQIAGPQAKVTGSVIRWSEGAIDGGPGIEVLAGARLTLERSVIAAARTAGVTLGDGANLYMAKSIVQDTRADSGGDRGIGILALGSASDPAYVDIRQSVIRRNRMAGAWLSHSCATIEQTIVENSQARECDGAPARGLVVVEDSPPACGADIMCGADQSESRCDNGRDLTLTDSILRNNPGAAAYFCGTTASLGDCVIQPPGVVQIDGDAQVDNRCQATTPRPGSMDYSIVNR